MQNIFGYYQDLVGLMPPQAQLIISGLILIFLIFILIKFFIKNLFLILIFILLAPIYYPVIKNFLANLGALL